MTARRVRWALWLALILTAGHAGAQPLGFRWVDELGNVHYAGRLDQVPERYRDQLGPQPGAASPKPQLTPPARRGIGGPVTGECILRFRGTERRRGSSQSYPSCDACWKALKRMRGEDAARAECVPTSVESYR